VNILSCPTGSVTITDSVNGGAAQPVDAGTFALNSAGYTEDQGVYLSGGSHMLTAAYGGDSSYTKSTSGTYPLTVTPASTISQITAGSTILIGQTLTLIGNVSTPVPGGAIPTGTINFYDGGTLLPGNVTLTSVAGNSPTLIARLNTSVTTVGTHSLTAQYSGDANYAASTSQATNVAAFYPTTTSVTSSSTNIIFGQSVTVTATVNTSNPAPVITGTVAFNNSLSGGINGPVTQTTGTDASGNTQIIATVSYSPQGSEYISASYSGDTNYASSAHAVLVSVTTPDFSVAPPSPITITAGQTGTTTLVITPASNLGSTVLLTCAGNLPIGSTCSFNPSSVNLANGANGSSILSVTSIGPSASSNIAPAIAKRAVIFDWIDGLTRNFPRAPKAFGRVFLLGTVLAASLLLLGLLASFTRRRSGYAVRNGVCAAALGYVMGMALGCGGGGGGGIITPPQPVPTTTMLSSPAAKVAAGSMVNFTATVSSSKALTGSVTFFAGGAQIGNPVLLVAGSAQAQISLPFPGATAISATYSGDANNLSSSSATFYEVTTGSTVFNVNAQTGVNNHQANVTITIQ
jgi:hypothetical protein